MGNAMKGYELNDAVKNDSRFTAKEKAVIENIQKNKGHNQYTMICRLCRTKHLKAGRRCA